MLGLRRAGAGSAEILDHGLANEPKKAKIGQSERKTIPGRNCGCGCCFLRCDEMTYSAR